MKRPDLKYSYLKGSVARSVREIIDDLPEDEVYGRSVGIVSTEQLLYSDDGAFWCNITIW